MMIERAVFLVASKDLESLHHFRAIRTLIAGMLDQQHPVTEIYGCLIRISRKFGNALHRPDSDSV